MFPLQPSTSFLPTSPHRNGESLRGVSSLVEDQVKRFQPLAYVEFNIKRQYLKMRLSIPFLSSVQIRQSHGRTPTLANFVAKSRSCCAVDTTPPRLSNLHPLLLQELEFENSGICCTPTFGQATPELYASAQIMNLSICRRARQIASTMQQNALINPHFQSSLSTPV